MDSYAQSSLAVLKIQETPLSVAFFSKQNLDGLQAKIRKRVRGITGFTIGDQSEPDLIAITRDVYVSAMKNYGVFGSEKVDKQVRSLNKRVLRLAIPIILSNLRSYLIFVRAQEQGVAGLKFPEAPINASQTGLR